MDNAKCLKSVSSVCTKLFPKTVVSLFILYRTVLVFMDYIEKGKVKFSDPNVSNAIKSIKGACDSVSRVVAEDDDESKDKD